MDSDRLQDLFKTITGDTVIEIALVIGGALLLVWLSQQLLPRLAERLHNQKRLFVLALIPTFRIVVLVVAILWIVPLVIKPSMQNMVAILGAAGLAIGFALKDYVSSLLAGIVAAYELPYRPGDWVEVGGTYGEVKHVGLRSVEVVTADDTIVFIPHMTLWTEQIHNANNGGASLMCVANFYLDPDHDAHQVRRVLEDVALSSPYIKLAKPVAVVLNEEPWGTHYKVRAYPMDPRQQFQFIADLTARGKQCLRDLPVQFARLPPRQEMDNA